MLRHVQDYGALTSCLIQVPVGLMMRITLNSLQVCSLNYEAQMHFLQTFIFPQLIFTLH